MGVFPFGPRRAPRTCQHMGDIPAGIHSVADSVRGVAWPNLDPAQWHMDFLRLIHLCYQGTWTRRREVPPSDIAADSARRLITGEAT
jgi:hypothetical protein